MRYSGQRGYMRWWDGRRRERGRDPIESACSLDGGAFSVAHSGLAEVAELEAKAEG
jgi:hypothetical protein